MTECRGIHPDVRRLCREAVQALNRYPVKDVLAMEPTEDDNGDGDVEDEKKGSAEDFNSIDVNETYAEHSE